MQGIETGFETIREGRKPKKEEMTWFKQFGQEQFGSGPAWEPRYNRKKRYRIFYRTVVGAWVPIPGPFVVASYQWVTDTAVCLVDLSEIAR
jgi:hypothetical protein